MIQSVNETGRILMLRQHRVALQHNPETTEQFYGNVAKSKISGKLHNTKADCVQGEVKD
jgi:hypothetical protein